MAGGSAGQDRRPAPRLGYFVAAVAGILVLQIVYGLVVFERLAPMEARGQFGDLFGGLNTLFTGLAFAGLIYTILLQRRELGLQREELRLTRGELRASAEAQTGQVEQLKETVNLGVLTALLNVYEAELQPLRQSLQALDSNLAAKEADLQANGGTWSDEMRRGYAQEISRLKTERSNREDEFGPVLGKHARVVEQLEQLRARMGRGETAP